MTPIQIKSVLDSLTDEDFAEATHLILKLNKYRSYEAFALALKLARMQAAEDGFAMTDEPYPTIIPVHKPSVLNSRITITNE